MLAECSNSVSNIQNFRTLLTTFYIALRLKHDSAKSLITSIIEMNRDIMHSSEITKRDFMRQVKTLLMFSLLNKELVKPILEKLETHNEKSQFNLAELTLL